MITPVTQVYADNTPPATSNVILPQKAHRTIYADNLAWLDASPGMLPNNVLSVVSVNGQPLYVCNAKAFDGVQPGQVTRKGCLITYNGTAIAKKNFKVLAGTAQLVWRGPSVIYLDQSVQSNVFYGVIAKGMNIDLKHYAPVIGGYESQAPSYLHPLYICRASVAQSMHIGKVVAGNCNIAINGKEVQEASYQVLSTAVGVKASQHVAVDADAPIKDQPRALVFD